MPNVALVSLIYCAVLYASKYIELYINFLSLDATDDFCNFTNDTVDYSGIYLQVFSRRTNSVKNLEKTIDVSQKYGKSSILSFVVKLFVYFL